MTGSLYLDCSNGLSGDMLVAALLDAGASEERLRSVLASLPMAREFEVRVNRRTIAGLDACDFDVVLAHGETHDHDMAYLHGHGHAREQDAAAPEHHHHHAHRNLAGCLAIVDAAAMTDGARAIARRAFQILADAEATAHGTTPDQVHFHEVGAVDSIVDFVAAAVLIDDLAPRRVYAAPLPDGHGTVRCQHGVIAVPVPAVVNICQQQGLPFAHVDVEGELTTPTGAALLAAVGTCFELPAAYTVRKVGLGAGKRAYAVPSLLRALLIDDVAGDTGHICKLECDIDDATPELLAYAAERLRTEGAREVHWLPVFSKKGRPAYQLQVIVVPQDIERIQGVIFQETTTIGIRRQLMDRTVLPREESTVETPFGPARVKTVTLPDGSTRSKPEFDDLAAIARREGLPLRVVDAAVRKLI